MIIVFQIFQKSNDQYRTWFKYLLLNHHKYNYLHCKSAQNMPLFLETVSESELIVRKFPCAVHNTELQRNGEKQMMHEYKAGKALPG